MVYFAWGALPHDPVYKWRKLAAWLATPYSAREGDRQQIEVDRLRKLKLVKPFQIAFVAGDALMPGDANAAKVVPINYFDYDHYVKTKRAEGPRLVARPYVVFLDINLPYHSDLEFCGRPQNRAGRLLSISQPIFWFAGVANTGSRRHRGSSQGEQNSATFEGRQVFRLVTADLVKDAEFVISHTSTAMSYAVLNAKPLIFIYTDAMAAVYQRLFIREMRTYADYLDAPLYNIDEVSSARQVAVRTDQLRIL